MKLCWQGVWLVGGNQSHADRLLTKHPVMAKHAPVLLPEAPMNKAFAADMLGAQNSYPSTGFVGIQAVLHCTQPSVVMHVYGFNWSKRTWKGHNVSFLPPCSCSSSTKRLGGMAGVWMGGAMRRDTFRRKPSLLRKCL